MGDALPSSWLVMPRAQDRNLLWPNTKLSPQESKRSHLKRPTILIPTKFVSLSLIINDRLVRQIIRSAKTCIVREGGKATVVTSSVITKSHGMGSRLGEFCVIKLCIWPALPRQNSPDLKHQIWTLKSSQCMQWNSHRWASTEIKLEGKEKQECVRSKVQQPGATRNGAWEISPVKLSSFSLPTDDDDPLLWSPSFISSSHRERWTAPLKSDLHIESGSRDRGRKGEKEREELLAVVEKEVTEQ